MKIAVIGGGAAGFFAAIRSASLYPAHEVVLLEKSTKLLSKVKVSGGGRCNVTHACFVPSVLAKNYPRGGSFLKKIFPGFHSGDMVKWLEERGVALKTEDDGRMFPTTDDSQTIIDCFLNEVKKNGIKISTQKEVSQIIPKDTGGFTVEFRNKECIEADRVIVATGGSPKESGQDWLKELGHSVEKPVPSLFTFNMPGETIRELMGVAVPKVRVRMQGTKLTQEGALLVTHWGMSGPAILKLSAWGANVLYEANYQFAIQVNWLPMYKEAQLREQFYELKHSKKKITNTSWELPKRLWVFLLKKVKINLEKKWQELSKTDINRLCNVLNNDIYEVKGKTTFKEEFVTCGGVSLQEVDFHTMESKKVPGLYFTGEVLNIDAITGGFNFQAAWTTAYVAGTAVGKGG